jgi:hypothetical protein
MKVRVYGYKFEADRVPPAMSRLDLYEYMEKNAGCKLGAVYQYGAVKVKLPNGPAGVMQEWWGGMLLKIRDAKAYMKLTEKDGKTVLTAEDLAENEKLAEVNFFLAHPETGSGLYAHHSQSASLINFGRVCNRVFNTDRREQKKTEVNGNHLSKDEQEAIKSKYEGELIMGQLCMTAGVKDLVRSLHKVSSFEYRFSTVKTHEKFLQGISEQAESETIRFSFPPDADVDALADSLDASLAEGDVDEFKVKGVDKHGKAQEYRLATNPLIFDEYDYDSKMKGLVLDLSDWKGSITNSVIIAHLGKVASNRKVMQLLKKA